MLKPNSLSLKNNFYLTEVRLSDWSAFVLHNNKSRAIHDNTLRVPYPYTEADAHWWTECKEEETLKNGRPVTFAIREPGGFLVGSVGFDGMTVGDDYRAELGYWIAEDYWGQGIMTNAVMTVCKLGFDDLGLEKITANAFAHNIGSQRVLQKSGFEREGLLRKHYKKGGGFVDAILYGLLKEDYRY